MELCPRNSDHITCMRDIQQPIVVVFVAYNTFTGQIAVINPDLGRELNLNQIIAFLRIMELEIAKNDIGLFLDTEAASGKTLEYVSKRFHKLSEMSKRDLPELAPTPRTVVSPTRSTTPQPLIMPEMTITPADLAAAMRAAHVVTVVPVPVPPPVVPAP